MSDSIIIVGASHAGIVCAEQLRVNGFSGPIQLIDRLSGFPFERPPLSKGFLQADGSDDEKFLLRRNDWFTSREITLIAGREVTAIDPETKQLQPDEDNAVDTISWSWLPVRFHVSLMLLKIFKMCLPCATLTMRMNCALL